MIHRNKNSLLSRYILFFTFLSIISVFSQNKKNKKPTLSKVSNKVIYKLDLTNGKKNISDIELAGLKFSKENQCNEKVQFYYEIPIVKIKTNRKIPVSDLPKDLKAFDFKWSPNYERFAFCNIGTDGVELWYVDLFNFSAKKLDISNLNTYFGSCYNWLHDSNSLVVKQFVKENKKFSNPKSSSYLSSSESILNFKELSYSEYYKYSLLGSDKIKLIKADYFCFEDYSPDGKYILVSKINSFEKDVAYKNFAQTYVVYDSEGKFIKEIEFQEYFHPKEYATVRSEKRNILWKSDQGSTLIYVIAVDGGEIKNSNEYKDELWAWKAPFNNKPDLVMKSMNRLAE